MTDARRRLIEWCRAQQRAAQAHIAIGHHMDLAMLGASDALHEELLANEGERDEQTTPDA